VTERFSFAKIKDLTFKISMDYDERRSDNDPRYFIQKKSKKKEVI